MLRPLVSIVMATFERGHLLARSLDCYEKSLTLTGNPFPKEEIELVVIDDHSTDATSKILREWSHRTEIATTIITASPKREAWRDCGAVLNHGIRASRGHHVILTHPEVMPGRKSVAACVFKLEEFERVTQVGHRPQIGLYACCRIYYLSPRDQVYLDRVPWQSEGPLAVRQIAGFYDEDTNGMPDYTHRATDIVAQPGSRLPKWESWVFGGCSRHTWKLLGGMLETKKWGSVDVAFIERRRVLGIPNHTCPDDDTICVHQNHDLPGEVETPRIMDVWVEELKGYDLKSKEKLMYPHVDHLS